MSRQARPGEPQLDDRAHLNTGLELREKLWLPHGATRQKGSPMAITLSWSGQVDFLRLVERSGPTASAVHKPCSPAVPGRSSLHLQLGHWSSSVPQNECSNTYHLQGNQANKDTYGGTLRRNYRNQFKSYSGQEVIQGVICKLANRKAKTLSICVDSLKA